MIRDTKAALYGRSLVTRPPRAGRPRWCDARTPLGDRVVARLRHPLGVGVGILAASMSLTSCGSGATSPSLRSEPTTAPASTAPVPAYAAQLAPGGNLRVALNLGNAFLAFKGSPGSPDAGEYHGIAADLGAFLAYQLKADFIPVEYKSVPELMAGLQRSEWDIAFLANDASRVTAVDFTNPYLQVDVTYLVGPHATVHGIADVDQAGVRVAVMAGNAADAYLSAHLEHATLVRSGSDADALTLLRQGHADALASSRLSLTKLAPRLPGSVVLDGNFTEVLHSMAVPKGHDAALTYLNQFIDLQRTGAIVGVLQRYRFAGIEVAPAGVTAIRIETVERMA